MAKYKIRLLQPAWDDLARIELWYLMQFDSDTAIKVSDAILSAIDRLATHPDSGKLTPDEVLNQTGYRMIVCKYHAAFYKRLDRTIYVYHIADLRTEYTRLFDGMKS